MRLQLRDWMQKFLETPASYQPSASSPGIEHLAVDVSGVRLRAWVTPDRALAVDVDVSRGWSNATEKALYEALDQRSASLVAGLLLWEWRALRDECEAQSQRPAQLQLRAVS